MSAPSDQALRERLELRLSVHRAVADVLATAQGMSDASLALLSALAPAGGWTYGALWIVDSGRQVLRCEGVWSAADQRIDAFAAESRRHAFTRGEGLPGRVWASRNAVWVTDLGADASFPRAAAARLAGLRCALAFPVATGGELRAVLELLAPQARPEDPDFLALLGEVGSQLGQFIERKRAEAAQRASDTLKSAILEAALDAIITIDSRGCIVEFNRAAQRLFGYPKDAVLGKEMAQIILPPQLREAHREGLARYLESGEAKILGRRIEMSAMRAGGEIFPVELTVMPIAIEGAAPMFTGQIRDISERKAQETELRRHTEALAEQHRQKDAFLAMLAHELRNPLAPIRNAVQIMRLVGQQNPALKSARDVVDRQVHALTRLVDDLLDVSRITRGMIELRRERVALAEVIDQAVEISRPLIEGRQHRLEVSVEAGAMELDADLTRLAQVVSNLLNNAAKYTPDGGRITLAAGREGNEAVVRVRDSGAGIDPALLPRIFDLFVQGDQSLDRAQGGLGIGLTLVKSLVKLHGGTVEAHSAGYRTGSEFVVRLPVLPAARPAPGEPRLAQAEALRPPPPLRVLVVDDNRDAAQTLVQLIRLWGYEAAMCYDGESALERTTREPPDVVLLDIGLPGLDGYEVARRMRAALPGESPLLIALTGYGRQEDQERTRQAGFCRHLTKPVDGAFLERLLGEIAAQRERE